MVACVARVFSYYFYPKITSFSPMFFFSKKIFFSTRLRCCQLTDDSQSVKVSWISHLYEQMSTSHDTALIGQNSWETAETWRRRELLDVSISSFIRTKGSIDKWLKTWTIRWHGYSLAWIYPFSSHTLDRKFQLDFRLDLHHLTRDYTQVFNHSWQQIVGIVCHPSTGLSIVFSPLHSYFSIINCFFWC